MPFSAGRERTGACILHQTKRINCVRDVFYGLLERFFFFCFIQFDFDGGFYFMPNPRSVHTRTHQKQQQKKKYTLSVVLMVMNSGLRSAQSEIRLFAFQSSTLRTNISHLFLHRVTPPHTRSFRPIHAFVLFYLYFRYILHAIFVNNDKKLEEISFDFIYSSEFNDNYICDCSFNIAISCVIYVEFLVCVIAWKSLLYG